jgi:cystinosin
MGGFYFTYQQRGDQTVHPVTMALCGGAVLGMLVLLPLAAYEYMTWFRYILSWSYVKVAATWLKYMPQVSSCRFNFLHKKAYSNYKRKSTIGWSIANVLLDISGGLLSFSQQFIDAINSGNHTEILV